MPGGEKNITGKPKNFNYAPMKTRTVEKISQEILKDAKAYQKGPPPTHAPYKC